MKLVINLLSVKLWLTVVVIVLLYYILIFAAPFKMIDVEVFRKISPDGTYEAVYIQQDAGAMTTAIHRIFIVNTGEKVSSSDKAQFIAKRVFDLECNWCDDGNFKISFSKAEINSFTNYIYKSKDKLEKLFLILDQNVE